MFEEKITYNKYFCKIPAAVENIHGAFTML